MMWFASRPDPASIEHDLAAERRALRDISTRLSAANDEMAALRASLVERTHERDTAIRASEAAEAKFLVVTDALAYERQRNKELADRLLALTDRRALAAFRGEIAPPVQVETEPPRSPRAPIVGAAGTYDPAKVDIEALFRMQDNRP